MLHSLSRRSRSRGFTLLELLLAIAILAILASLIGVAAANLFNKSKTVVAGGTLIQAASLLNGTNTVRVNGSEAGMYLALLKTNNAPAPGRATSLFIYPMAPLTGTLAVTPTNAATSGLGEIQFTVSTTNYEGPALLVIRDNTTNDVIPVQLHVKN